LFPEEFSFLFNLLLFALKVDHPEKGFATGQSISLSEVLGAQRMSLENPGEKFDPQVRSYSYPHQVSKVRSL